MYKSKYVFINFDRNLVHKVKIVFSNKYIIERDMNS